jgi:hypothetical protein
MAAFHPLSLVDWLNNGVLLFEGAAPGAVGGAAAMTGCCGARGRCAWIGLVPVQVSCTPRGHRKGWGGALPVALSLAVAALLQGGTGWGAVSDGGREGQDCAPPPHVEFPMHDHRSAIHVLKWQLWGNHFTMLDHSVL